MRLTKKHVRIIVSGAICLGLIVLAFHWPSQPKLIVPLADGSRFVLASTDSGRRLCYGGGLWQRLVCKGLGRELPAFVHGQPVIWPATYPKGIGLYFCRTEPDGGSLKSAWNGSGQLYYLDESNLEHWVPYHSVNFDTMPRGPGMSVVAEQISFEMPMRYDAELRLRIRETNDSTGAVELTQIK
jgi:hypothetical protein